MSARSHRLARLVEIITLVQSGANWGPKRLAQHFGISQTRIHQDIKELSVAGVPISFTGKGYQIDESFFLPALNLTTQEIFLLLFPDHQFCSDSFGPVRDRLRAKLLSCVPATLRQMLNESLDRTYMKPEATTERDETFQLIHQAVAERLRTVIDYRSLEAADFEERSIDPLGLAYRNHAWYVVAKCRKRNEVRTFKLSRIRPAVLTDLQFTYPENFSIQEYFAQRWGMFGGEEQDVVIRFLPLAARLVENKPPVKNGSFMQMSDGSAIFTAHVRGVQEIVWWVMKYGDQAEVIRPAHLRMQVIDTIRKMAFLYDIDLPKTAAAEDESDYTSAGTD